MTKRNALRAGVQIETEHTNETEQIMEMKIVCRILKISLDQTKGAPHLTDTYIHTWRHTLLTRHFRFTRTRARPFRLVPDHINISFNSPLRGDLERAL